jgi:hypothetical protein
MGDFDSAKPDFQNTGETSDIEQLWFFCTCLTWEQTPFFNTPALARIVQDTLLKTIARHPIRVWGYVILPAMMQAVVEVDYADIYQTWIEEFKATSEQSLVKAILTRYKTWLDAISFFNPVWGEVIYRVWQEGYHTQSLHSPYAVSNRVAELLQKPVEEGLASSIEAWPFSSYQRQS